MPRSLSKIVRIAKGQLPGTQRFRRYVGKNRFYTTLRTPKPKPHKLKKAVSQAQVRQQQIKVAQKAQRRASLQAKAQSFQQKQVERRTSVGAKRFRARTGKGPGYTMKRKSTRAPARPRMSRGRKIGYGIAGGALIGGAAGAL